MIKSSSKITTQELVELFCQKEDIAQSILYVSKIDLFFLYDNTKGYYKLLSLYDLEKNIYRFISNNTSKNMSVFMVKDFIGQLKYTLYNIIPDMDFNYLAINNLKCVNVNTLKIEDNAQSKSCFHWVDCDAEKFGEYDETKIERWLQFLDEVIVTEDMEPDKKLQDLIQEMMGYYLLNTTEAHVVFFCTGKGRNGKSVLLDLMRTMIGEEHCEAMSVETMTTDQFAVAGLVGKKMNICSEDESKFVKSDKFKAMVGGDHISVRRIYGSRFMWKPTVNYLFSTNDMPAFSGYNKALTERIIIIPFNRYFKAYERDTKLTQKLMNELGGIILWALVGAKRLKENKFKFTKTAQTDITAQEFQQNISASVLFFNENYEKDENSFVSNIELYEDYKIWAEVKGKKKQSYYVFIKDIETLTDLKTTLGKNSDHMTAEGKRVRRKVLMEPNLLERIKY